MFEGVGQRVFLQDSWLNGRFAWLLSLLLGLLGGLAFLSFGLLPALFPSLGGLFWVCLRANSYRQALLLAWLHGLGAYLVSLHWVGEAFLVDPLRHGWMLPFALAALCGGMGLFTLFLAGAFRFFSGLIKDGQSPPPTFASLSLFVALWLFFEWLRSWFFTGFPWNLMGQVWVSVPEVLQFASLFGVWGLSFLTLVFFTAPTLWFLPRRKAPVKRSGGSWRRNSLMFFPFVAFAIVIFVFVWGRQRLDFAGRSGGQASERPLLRLVQPNIDQKDKWTAQLRSQHIRSQMLLSLGIVESPESDEVPKRRPNHLIWAETAVPSVVEGNPALQQTLARIVPAGGTLITGAPRIGTGDDGSRRYYNSLHVINQQGQITETYDKAHLVPFGEYTPLLGALGGALGLKKMTSFGDGGFSAGPGPRTIAVEGLPPFSPLICYEVVFPGAVVDDNHPAEWMLNITNDAWFGGSSGPYQHLSIAQLRAVEEGLPLIRVANTGISAAIDAYGRLQASIPLKKRGFIDVSLPPKTPETTLFSSWGNFLILPLIAFALFPFAMEAVAPCFRGLAK